MINYDKFIIILLTNLTTKWWRIFSFFFLLLENKFMDDFDLCVINWLHSCLFLINNVLKLSSHWSIYLVTAWQIAIAVPILFLKRHQSKFLKSDRQIQYMLKFWISIQNFITKDKWCPTCGSYVTFGTKTFKDQITLV